MTCPEVTYLPLKAPDFFSASPRYQPSLMVPLEGLVHPGSAQLHRPGVLESVRTYNNGLSIQEEGTVHTKYLEGDHS